VDIATGAIADSITVLTSEQDGNTVFESIGQFTNANGETEYYLIGAPNSRITDTNYKAENDSKGHMAWYTLKFTDNGISTESKASFNIASKLLAATTQQLAYGNFQPYYDTSDEYYHTFGAGLVTDKSLDLKNENNNNQVQTNYTYRCGFFLDRFNIYSSNTLSTSNAPLVYAPEGTYGYKFQFQFTSNIPKSTSTYLVNFAKESTSKIDYGPALICTNSNKSTTVTSLGLEGKGIRGGDAIKQFTLYNKQYIVYSSQIEDEKSTFKIVRLPKWTSTTPSFANAAEMWEIPLAVTDKSNADGESITAIAVETSADESGNEYADIYLYAQGQGLARYRMQEYYGEPNAVSDITVNADNATWSIDNNVLSVNTDTPSAINVYNALGACVAASANNQINISSLASGMYIAKCGAHAYKFVIK
jgi:hypothetical protein